MSSCNCDSKSYRVSGEVDGDGMHRIRCNNCGGKTGWIPTDTLRRMGVPNEKLATGGGVGGTEHTIEVDLL